MKLTEQKWNGTNLEPRKEENMKLEERMESLEKRLQQLEKQQNPREDNNMVQNSKLKDVDQSKNYISYRGHYKAEKVESTFGGDVNLERILDSADLLYDVIAPFGNQERLKIVKALLQRAMTVKELMEITGFETTGKVYHHLNALEKARLIKKYGEFFRFDNSKVSCIMLMLVAASQLQEKQNRE